jgi:hypothetical protein
MTPPWPSVTPLPGISRVQLRDSLHHLWGEATNIRNGTYGSGPKQLASYLNWTSGAVKVLKNQVRSADIDRLVLTRGYERLLALVGPAVNQETVSVMNEMLNVELTQRVDDFEAVRDSLNDAISRWSGFSTFIMPDTSVYIEHTDKLADLDFAEVIYGQLFPNTRLVVLVPIVVIDELDRLKESSNKQVRWRATHALGFIDSLFQETSHPGLLRSSDSKEWRGPVVMELVFDPPGHVRLPIDDDEIVDRALAIGSLAGSPVTLITFDTGQSLRARNAGLTVKKLTRPKAEQVEGEDLGAPSRRQVRRERQAARV